jgi:4-amino-4-deoxy-L-arabinose transferase-like glycosyltransferase
MSKKDARPPGSARNAPKTHAKVSPPAGADSPVAPAPAARTRLDAFLERRQYWVIAAILAVAVLMRVALLAQTAGGPLVQMHTWDQTDMNYYDFWAKRILAGDYLCENVPPPWHSWHGMVAGTYLDQNPALKAELEAQARSELAAQVTVDVIPAGKQLETQAEKLLWVRWLGPKRFYQEPAYPYLIALTYRVFGPQPIYVLIWQMMIGVISVLLIHRIAERHFGRVVAAVAGLLAALCGTLLMHELTLLRDSLIVFAGLLTVYLTDQAVDRGRWQWWLLTGMALGMGLMLKGIFNLYALALLVILVAACWRRWKFMAISAVSVAAGVLLLLSPMIARNLVVGVPPLALAGNATFAFIESNAADYDWRCVSKISPDFATLLGKTGGKTLPAIVETLKSHPNVGSVVSMVLHKFDAAWHWWERPDNANFHSYREFAPVLKWAFVTFTLLAPLALVGLGASIRGFRRHLSLYALLLTGLAPMVIFNVVGRFRLPMLAACIPFAAFTLVQIARWVRGKNWIKAGIAAAAVILLACWTARSLPPGMSQFRAADYSSVFLTYYQPRIQQALADNDPLQANAEFDEFFRYEPPLLKHLRAPKPPETQDEAALAMLFVQLHAQYGQILQQEAKLLPASGAAQAAQEQFRQAQELQDAARHAVGLMPTK